MIDRENLLNQFEKAKSGRDRYALRFVKQQLDEQRILLNEEGDKFFSLKQYELAIAKYKDALFYARLVSDYRIASVALVTLANAYSKIGQFNQATEYYREAASVLKSAASGLKSKEENLSPWLQPEKKVSSYLEQRLRFLSKHFYLVTLFTALLVIIAVGFIVLITRNPSILFVLQLVIILLYVVSYYFRLEERSEM